MKKIKGSAEWDDQFQWTIYELIADKYAVSFSLIFKIPVEQIIYQHEVLRGDCFFNVNGWFVHIPNGDAECQYFGTCRCYEAVRWDDKRWILDNLTPDPDEFDRRVWARMQMLGERYSTKEEDDD
jgi:hypothetical protein